MKYDFLIVGCGLFGATFGREMTDAGRSVLIIDRREHVGGNVFTKNTDGINVHVYGPHIFHTDSKRIWKYVNRFAEFNHFVLRPKVCYRGTLYSFPINLMTLQQLWGVRTPAEAEHRLAEARIPCANPRNLEQWILSQVGEEIYRTFVYGYTKKQWQREPKDLPASIIKRLPIRLTYDDNYFEHRYQGIPIGGYTSMVDRMLNGIRVELGTPFSDIGDWRRLASRLVFTGRIDEFFDFAFGRLAYRSLDFRHETRNGDFQGVSQVNYTEESVPYTRIIEHKHFQFNRCANTVITREYPVECDRDGIPYYPINDQRNDLLRRSYVEEARKLPNVLFGGRLAEYRYYDMHQVIGSAIAAVDRVLGRRRTEVAAPDSGCADRKSDPDADRDSQLPHA